MGTSLIYKDIELGYKPMAKSHPFEWIQPKFTFNFHVWDYSHCQCATKRDKLQQLLLVQRCFCYNHVYSYLGEKNCLIAWVQAFFLAQNSDLTVMKTSTTPFTESPTSEKCGGENIHITFKSNLTPSFHFLNFTQFYLNWLSIFHISFSSNFA